MSSSIERAGEHLRLVIASSSSPGAVGEEIVDSLERFLQAAGEESAPLQLQGRILQEITKGAVDTAEQKVGNVFFDVVVSRPSEGMFGRVREMLLGGSNPQYLSRLLGALGLSIDDKFSDAEKLDLLKMASHALTEDMEEDLVAKVLSTVVSILQNIKEEDKESAVRGLRDLFAKGIDKNGLEEVLSVFSGQQNGDIAKVCDLAGSLILGVIPRYDLGKVLIAAKNAIASNRNLVDVLEEEVRLDLLTRETGHEMPIYFVERREGVFSESLVEFAKGARIFLRLDAQSKQVVVKAAHAMDDEKKAAVWCATWDIAENKDLSPQEKAFLLTELSYLDLRDLDSAKSFLLIFLKKGLPKENIAWLIGLSRLMDQDTEIEESKEELKEIYVRKAERYIREEIEKIVSAGGEDVVKNVRSQVYFAERCFGLTGILDEIKLSPLAEGQNEQGAMMIWSALRQVDPAKVDFIKSAILQLNLPRDMQVEVVLEAIRALNEVDRRDFDLALEAFQGPLRDIFADGSSSILLGEVLRASREIADLAERGLEEIQTSLKEHLYNALTEMMEEMVPWNRIESLGHQIERHRQLLSLEDRDPLATLVAKVQVENEQAEPIYKVHENLLEKRKEGVSPSVREVEIAGERYSFDFPEFLQLVNAKEEVKTYKDLPSIDRGFCGHMVERLEGKIRRDESALQEVLTLFPPPEDGTVTDDFLYNVRRSSVDSTSALARALNKSGKEDEEVRALTLSAYTLISSLEGISDDPVRGDPLTPRERSFLEVIASIQNCPTGQEDGLQTIAGMFEKEKVSLAETRDVMKCLLPTFALLAKQREALLRSEEFLLKLVDSENVALIEEQGSHQTKYLRSLLKEELGLLHDVKVDLAGAYADKLLRNLSKQEVLKVFYEEYFPIVREMLQEKINEEIAEGNRKLYNDIVHSIALPADEAFEFDEDSNRIVITSKGLAAFLQQLGILKSLE